MQKVFAIAGAEGATRYTVACGAGGGLMWAQMNQLPGDGYNIVGINLPHIVFQPIEGQATAAVRYVDAEGRVVDLGLVAALDTTVTPELEAEGLARDLVRLVQQTRKDLDLAITDRIALDLALPAPIDAAVRRHEGAVRDAVLATSVTYLDAGGDDFVSFTVGALPVALRVRRS